MAGRKTHRELGLKFSFTIVGWAFFYFLHAHNSCKSQIYPTQKDQGWTKDVHFCVASRSHSTLGDEKQWPDSHWCSDKVHVNLPQGVANKNASLLRSHSGYVHKQKLNS